MSEEIKTIISYDKDFYHDGFIIGKRNAMFWAGEVECTFDFVVSKDKRIIDAYKSFGVPEFISEEKPKAPRKKRQSKVKKELQEKE